LSSFRLESESGPFVVPPLVNKATVWFSLVVPTYNEAGNVEPLVEEVTRALEPRYKGRYEIIFSDDNSPDGTAAKVESLTGRFPQVKLMVREQERGLAKAVVRGWQKASGEILGVIDGDLQHPVNVLADLLAKVEEGADLVVASRYKSQGGFGNWGPIRRVQSQGAAVISWLILPEAVGQVSDPMSGCFAVSRRAIEGEPLHPEGYKIFLEVLACSRARKVDEVAYVFQLRQRGETKLSAKVYFEYLKQLVRLRLLLWQRKLQKGTGFGKL
jgi:dolichol-phosphate mannosyltransferase